MFGYEYSLITNLIFLNTIYFDSEMVWVGGKVKNIIFCNKELKIVVIECK